MEEKLFSICIPSYNRPAEIRRLLNSIDTTHVDEVEIVICEDKSPKREEIRKQVLDFKSKTQYEVNYIENEENCGYDKNLRNLIRAAKGHFIIFMGDNYTRICSRIFIACFCQQIHLIKKRTIKFFAFKL